SGMSRSQMRYGLPARRRSQMRRSPLPRSKAGNARRNSSCHLRGGSLVDENLATKSAAIFPKIFPSTTHQKTGEYVPVQIHSEYRSLIDATLPKSGVKILREDEIALHLREDGEAWTLAGARTAWQREITF